LILVWDGKKVWKKSLKIQKGLSEK
jgi:hypothetical protein